MLTMQQANEYRELARLIRIGAKSRPQGKGNHCWEEGKSCVLMAAYEAAGNGVLTAYADLYKMYKWADSRVGVNVTRHLWTKNDDGATRESLADWLDAQASEAEGQWGEASNGWQAGSKTDSQESPAAERCLPSPRPSFSAHLSAWNSGTTVERVEV